MPVKEHSLDIAQAVRDTVTVRGPTDYVPRRPPLRAQGSLNVAPILRNQEIVINPQSQSLQSLRKVLNMQTLSTASTSPA
ncbi:hypothetical protein H0H92_003135 [Tricholoma furcatifolium]|nr:hypothetical protein H0H92_003135 [Tricholoma furcatifolium]